MHTNHFGNKALAPGAVKFWLTCSVAAGKIASPRGCAVISSVIGTVRERENRVFPSPGTQTQTLIQLLCTGVTGIITLLIRGF